MKPALNSRFQEALENDDVVLLPQTQQEFDEFTQVIHEFYELPDLDLTTRMLETMVLHLPATKSHAELSYFGDSVRKAVANQIAYERIERRREKEKKLLEENQQKSDTIKTDEPSLSEQTVQAPVC